MKLTTFSCLQSMQLMQVQVDGINEVHTWFSLHCDHIQSREHLEVTCQGNLEENPIFEKGILSFFHKIYLIKVHIWENHGYVSSSQCWEWE